MTSADQPSPPPETDASNLAALLARLGDRDTVIALNHLLDNLDTLTGLLEITQSFLSRSEQIIDNLGDSVRDMTRMVTSNPETVNTVASVIKVGKQAMPLVQKLADTDAVAKISNSRILEPEVIDMIAKVFDSMRSVQAEIEAEPERRRISMVRLPLMMRDRDFNRGINFVLRVVRDLGWAVKPNGPHGIGPGRDDPLPPIQEDKP